MATTTNIQSWLEFIEPENYEEIYALYCSVIDNEELGGFKCISVGNNYHVTHASCDDTLVLTKSSKVFFLNLIQTTYVDSDMGIEGWFDYKRSMEKED
jgi:hypothetical protein